MFFLLILCLEVSHVQPSEREVHAVEFIEIEKPKHHARFGVPMVNESWKLVHRNSDQSCRIYSSNCRESAVKRHDDGTFTYDDGEIIWRTSRVTFWPESEGMDD